MDATGSAWLAGYTSGSLDGNKNAGLDDIFLMKFDAAGDHLWTRQRGGSGYDGAIALQARQETWELLARLSGSR